jgi:hypothetical protein
MNPDFLGRLTVLNAADARFLVELGVGTESTEKIGYARIHRSKLAQKAERINRSRRVSRDDARRTLRQLGVLRDRRGRGEGLGRGPAIGLHRGRGVARGVEGAGGVEVLEA